MNTDDRDRAQLRLLSPDVESFVASFRDNLNQNTAPESQRTVIFFPGGLASNLARAEHAQNVPPPSRFRPLWLTCRLLDKRAVDLLAMDDEADIAGGMVVAHGALDIMGYRPYADFERFCAANRLDVFTFGYDWRRRPEDSLRFFLEVFLPHLVEIFRAERLPDPLSDLTVIGHSLGGPLIKLLLHEDHPYVARIRRAIVVASPFYGYGGQTPRYFEGMKEFFWCSQADLARTIASLRGGYFLQFMDQETYAENAHAFADARWPLNHYPSHDPETGEAADPFVQSEWQSRVRYPSYVEADELSRARDIVRKLALPVPAQFANRFYCMKGVQSKGEHESANTIVAQDWKRVAPSYVPGDGPSPIAPCKGSGDGVQPAWTTALLGLPDAQSTSFVGDVEHTRMMDCAELRKKLLEIIAAPEPGALSEQRVVIAIDDASLVAETAGIVETQAFLTDLRNIYVASGADALDAVAAELAKIPQADKDRYARRILMMLLGSELP